MNAKYSVELIGISAMGFKRTKADLKGKVFNSDYKLYDTIEEATRVSKTINRGGKSYCGPKYVVVEVVDGKFTGK